MADNTSCDNSSRSTANTKMLDTAFLYGGSALWIEQMQACYARDPSSVPKSWHAFFADISEDIIRNTGNTAHKPTSGNAGADAACNVSSTGPMAFEARLAGRIQHAGVAGTAQGIKQAVKDSVRALMMIRAFRMRGHLQARLDPLGIDKTEYQPELDPKSYGFMETDMDRPVFIDGVLGLQQASIKQILEIVRRTYCSTIGIEFQHISSPKEKSWLQERIEGPDKGVTFTPHGKKAILSTLIKAETFERFLHKRYPGTKRFGLDGGEAAVPGLEQIIKRGGALGVDEIIIGMPHRGRLNVLATVMDKKYEEIFHEFMGGSTQGVEDFGSGDVKYHLGTSSDRSFDGNRVHLTMNANPSHLEAVNPVVLGRTRAKQFIEYTKTGQLNRAGKLPLLIHGDAAFSGQGVVSECFALSGLQGYRIGGTIHFIINNQIGFTTSPIYSRSSPYPSDVALMVQAPIFHVNGDDPEAVVYAAKVATEYRQKFGKDAVIDMFCYRRFGHNEGDEPMFTQPVMYTSIKKQRSTRELYAERLVAEGLVTPDSVNSDIEACERFLEKAFEDGKTLNGGKADWLQGQWHGLGLPADDERRGKTGVTNAKLKQLGSKITQVPNDLDIHRTLNRIVKNRSGAVSSGQGIDWALAEHLAFATLLDEGFHVRLSGQDSARGTFSQRHSHFIDQKTARIHTPLNHIRKGQGEYEVIDSLLSEEAVLGYEYGYSLAHPNALVLWEAQFGDFANGAQVFFDQFISSGERKWLRMSGLTLLLPHGYEGQGPEHSSARLERFLQMCAEDNWQVCNLTTPSNYFHALRRQIHRDFRKPLVIMTPKSLLRHKRAVSTLGDMNTKSSFHRVLWDDAETPGRHGKVVLVGDKKVRRVILCSGKVYYDLFDARDALGVRDVYLLRIEQFYPVPRKSMMTELKRFLQAEIVWCQEEPRNMGGWTFIRDEIEWICKKIGSKNPRPKYVGRLPAAATATGLLSLHNKEKEAFINTALSDKLVEDSLVV